MRARPRLGMEGSDPGAAGVSEAPASLCRCPRLAFRAVRGPGACGATALAGLMALVMAALALDARRWVRLAARSRVGARSEEAVRRALGGLEREGWRLRHSLLWGGRGDIDSVAIAPTGVAFAIETKARMFDARHLAHARQTAAWLYERRRRWCRRGALPVLCVVRAHGLEGPRTGFSWCRLTAWFRRSEPALGPHPGPGSWPRSPRPAEAQAFRVVASRRIENGRRRRRTGR